MIEELLFSVVIVSPLLLFLTAGLSLFQSGSRPNKLMRLSLVASALGIIGAAVAGALVYKFGTLQSPSLDFGGYSLSLRMDELSLLMDAMIGILGLVILKYSYNYMSGDANHGRFIGRLCNTLALVQLFVLSGSLLTLFIFWLLAGLSLRPLLIFYKNRPKARTASRKMFIVNRISDAFLIAAMVCLQQHFGTDNLAEIFTGMKGFAGQVLPTLLELSAVFLVLAALFKSAQFPVHSWLVEVMEAPTPVSALLHAGILNAGPFLITRMAIVIDGSQTAHILLIILGGFTALFGSITYITQSSVKTALSYSSIGHMGFSLLMSGMGVYSAAILHIIGHSFYKAHSFLSSGSTVELIRSKKLTVATRSGGLVQIFLGILLALAISIGFGLAWGLDLERDFGLLATCAVITMGMSQVIAPTLDAKATFSTLLKAIGLSLLVSTSFFLLEGSIHHLLGSQLPLRIAPTETVQRLIAGLILAFGVVSLAQLMAPRFQAGPFWQKMGVHFRNGWYINAYYDRFIGTFKNRRQENKVL